MFGILNGSPSVSFAKSSASLLDEKQIIFLLLHQNVNSATGALHPLGAENLIERH